MESNKGKNLESTC